MILRSLLTATVLALPLAAGCAYQPERYCESSADCEDPALPFCDVNGEFEASDFIGRTCIPDPFPPDDDEDEDEVCTPGAFVQCSAASTAIYCNDDGSELLTIECDAACDAEQGGCFCEPNTSSCSGDTTLHCGADGEVEEVESCALGCNDTGERCVDVAPSNDLGGYLDQADDAPVVVLTDGALIDTDAGTIENGDGTAVTVPSFQVTAPSGGVAIRVFAVKSLELGDTTVTGDRALAIVADEEIRVSGVLRVEAGAVATGPCVGSPGSHINTGGGFGQGVYSGGGGGGFGSRGGDGGDATGGGEQAVGGTGGSSSGTASLIPLRGGCRGEDGGAGSGAGGDAGGAIQLVSRRLVALAVPNGTAFINANGQGGSSYRGGGSGGGILIEAPKVVVPSQAGIVANGGAGGCLDESGEDGSLDGEPAAGGACPDPEKRDGGNGGAGSNPSGQDGESFAGSSADGTTGFAGSGGGGVGRIRINVPTASDFSEFGIVSPTPSVGTLQTR